MARNDILARLAVVISANTAELNKGMATANKSLSAFEKTATGVSNQLKGAIGALSFGILAKQVIDVTSEFQKFEAVLTNTLGSNSAAQKALSDIKDFAAATPFSVAELTSSFVKLANQGFTPTTEEIRKLGDLASSTGKSFDQLTEGIIDAQTGEFERLKEFGIRASKQGDQVKFTFKGVETQTKFTADAIRDYVLSLGNLEGVSGSMAAISQTLGGRISNLGDAFDNLLLSIGSSSSGPLNAIIESLTTITNAAANLSSELSLTAVGLGLKSFNSVAGETLDYLLKFGRTNSGKAVADVLAPITSQSNQQFLQNFNNNLREFTTLLQKEGEDLGNITVLWDHYLKKRREAAAADKEAALQSMTDAVQAAKDQALAYAAMVNSQGIIEKINIKLEELEQLKKKAFSTDEIASYNDKITNLKEELDLLNASHKLSNFGKRVFADSEAGLPSDLNIKDRGMNPSTTPFEIPPPNTSAFEESMNTFRTGFAEIQQTYADTGIIAYNSSAQQVAAFDQQIAKQQEAAATATAMGDALGDAIGGAITGQMSLVQSIKKATGEIVKTLLARAMAGIISSAATSGGPPPVAIALAAAGVAAIGALFSKFVGVGGGSSGGGSSLSSPRASISRMPNQTFGDTISFNAEFMIAGDNLKAVANNQDYKNGRLG